MFLCVNEHSQDTDIGHNCLFFFLFCDWSFDFREFGSIFVSKGKTVNFSLTKFQMARKI